MDKSPKNIGKMFNSIAKRYDFLNHILSFGLDYYWRKKTISLIAKYKPQNILDIATGTADLAIKAASIPNVQIIGMDISNEMLKKAENKINRKKLNHIINLREANSDKIPFEDNLFDTVMIGFGIRNFENINQSLQEMLRVLKHGGLIYILEFSKPQNGFFRKLSNVYTKKIMPFIANLFSKNKQAYQYLYESVEAFPTDNEFLNILQNNKFIKTKQHKLSFGICSIYIGEKQ